MNAVRYITIIASLLFVSQLKAQYPYDNRLYGGLTDQDQIVVGFENYAKFSLI